MNTITTHTASSTITATNVEIKSNTQMITWDAPAPIRHLRIKGAYPQIIDLDCLPHIETITGYFRLYGSRPCTTLHTLHMQEDDVTPTLGLLTRLRTLKISTSIENPQYLYGVAGSVKCLDLCDQIIGGRNGIDLTRFARVRRLTLDDVKLSGPLRLPPLVAYLNIIVCDYDVKRIELHAELYPHLRVLYLGACAATIACAPCTIQYIQLNNSQVNMPPDTMPALRSIKAAHIL